MASEERVEHILEQRFPGFLTLLDEDPDLAWEEFHTFAWKLLQAHPPRVFSELAPEVRADLIADIVLGCQKEDFRMLRSYRNQGVPFAAWLGAVARNRAISYLRHEELGVRVKANFHPGSTVLPDEEAHHKQVLAVVRECMRQLGQKCRLLLQAAADEFKPAEMAVLLGLSRGGGKKASDDLRSCRRGLKQLLQKRGLEPLFAAVQKDRV